MANPVTYIVVAEVSGTRNTESTYSTQRDAIAHANYLHKIGKYLTVQVYCLYGKGQQDLIYEKSYSLTGREAIIRPISDVSVCNNVDDIYRYDSRMTISRLIRNFLDKKFVSPSELLHGEALLSEIMKDQRFVNSICTRVATHQVSNTNLGTYQRVAILLDYSKGVLNNSKSLNAIDHHYDMFKKVGLSKFIEYFNCGNFPDSRDRVLSYILARQLRDERDWGNKVIAVCDMYKKMQSFAAEVCLDEFMSEVIDGAVQIKELIGASPNLYSSLETLSLCLDGSLREQNVHTIPLMALNNLLAITLLSHTQSALLNRISSAIASTTPLTRGDVSEQRTLFEKFVPSLQRFVFFVGGWQMAEAVTIRAKVLFGKSSENLPTEDTIPLVLDLFQNPLTKVTYLVELLFSKTGSKCAGSVVDLIRESIKVGYFTEDISTIRRMYIPDDDTEALIRKLESRGISRKVAAELITIFAQPVGINDQAVRGRPRISEPLNDLDYIDTPTMELPPQNSSVNLHIKNLTIGLVISRASDNEEWQINSARPRVSVGRSDGCDVFVSDSRVSRVHGYFMMTDVGVTYNDQSTNGSYVYYKDKKIGKVHKSGLLLESNGMVVLGEEPNGLEFDKRIIVKFKFL